MPKYKDVNSEDNNIGNRTRSYWLNRETRLKSNVDGVIVPGGKRT